jgi:hypothetical protein
MGIFTKHKLKIRRKTALDVTKINIDYYKIKEVERLKTSLLKDLMGNNLCLAIIDSRLQYKEMDSSIDDLVASLEKANILYRKKIVKEDETKKVLGISMKVSSSTKAKRYILGALFSQDNINNIEKIIKAYNIYYYFDFNNLHGEDLLDKIEFYFEDEEELFINFGLSVFDSNAFNNMNIKVNREYYSHANEVVENQYKIHKGHI